MRRLDDVSFEVASSKRFGVKHNLCKDDIS